MAAWWQTLTTLEQVLLYIAVPATLVLLIQTALLFLGGGPEGDGGDLSHDGMPDGGDGALDADWGDTPDTGWADGADLAPDGPPEGDFLPHDGEMEIHSGGEHPSQALHIFTLRGVVAFLTLFGWSGLWFSQLGLPGFLAVFLAVPVGFAGMVAIALMVREALKLQYDGTLNPRNALGRPGEVYLAIPPARSGQGKVTVLVQEQLREFEAVTDSVDPIPTGAPVVVTGLAGDALVVAPPPSLPEGPGNHP